MLILFSDTFDPSLPGKLQKFGETTEDAARLPDADVILIRSKTKATKEFLEKAKNLKLIIRGGVGLDNVDAAYAKSRGIIVKNTPEASSVAVAELAVAMMIASCNRLIDAHNSMREGKWLKKEIKRTELFQKTLGLIGAGRIGTEVAKRAAAFGMRVVAYDPLVKSSPSMEILGSVDEVLAAADYISLHVPLTDETKGMINKAAIAKMKKGVVIVNTARGKAVVEEDVAAALASGQIGTYCSDVFYQEPPEGSPLLKAPNVILAPHIGASSKENLLRIGVQVEQLIGDFSKGKLK
jgi:D-3-phosphoglycerate dehydrogenase